MTTNQISFYKAKQEARHYKRSDKETNRHNVATEGLEGQRNLLTDWYNRKQAEIGLGNMQANQYQADVAGQRAQIESRKQTLEEEKEYGNEWGNPISYRLKSSEAEKNLYEAALAPYKSEKLTAETDLINRQATTEELRHGLVEEQTNTEVSKQVSNYGKTLKDTVGGLTGIYRMVDGILVKVADSVPGESSVLKP